jgi:hypothetical protein
MTRYSKTTDPAREALEALTREYGPIIWRPISFLPVFAHLIDSGVTDTADLIATLTKARAKPHVLDDALLDRAERMHREQLGHIEIHRQQLHRWRSDNLSTAQRQEIDRLDIQNSRLRQMNAQVFALAAELRKGTINRVMEKSDLEPGIERGGVAATAEQIRIAAGIEAKMRELLGAGLNDVEIMAAMFDHMPAFKQLLDSRVCDELSERFPSFHRYAKMLENLAEALHDGVFADLGFGLRRSNDNIH